MAEINLQDFLKWYKTAEVVLGEEKRVFREPAIKDIKLWVIDILEKYCLEGNFERFKTIISEEVPYSQQQELINGILKNLGLV